MEEMTRDLYATLDDKEKQGLQYGMFPNNKCKGITREQSLDLLKLAKQERYQ